ESYAASALYTTLASLSGALSRIRRANMMDILTYDDLVRRLDNVIASLSQRRGAGRFVAKSLKR
ncbi:hypothetical protein, partial [Bradyrhizobium liaoningense]|uniref:hypothetical protein n=1 Tax=Bradyrhizobium liaoningense TaxID=43992 RepID=UPI001BA6AE2E